MHRLEETRLFAGRAEPGFVQIERRYRDERRVVALHPNVVKDGRPRAVWQAHVDEDDIRDDAAQKVDGRHGVGRRRYDRTEVAQQRDEGLASVPMVLDDGDVQSGERRDGLAHEAF
jgi:hypothetical protein